MAVRCATDSSTWAAEFLVRGRSVRGAADEYRTLKFSPSSPRFLTVRLRANWPVHHLTARTPLRDLLDAAGVGTSGVNTLIDLLPYVPALPADEARRLPGGATVSAAVNR